MTVRRDGGRKYTNLFAWLLFIFNFATGTDDFVVLMENGTLSEGNQEACYNISIEDDNTIEPQELFYVTLTSLPGPIQNLVNISPNRSSVLIIDNDGKNSYAVL